MVTGTVGLDHLRLLLCGIRGMVSGLGADRGRFDVPVSCSSDVCTIPLFMSCSRSRAGALRNIIAVAIFDLVL